MIAASFQWHDQEEQWITILCQRVEQPSLEFANLKTLPFSGCADRAPSAVQGCLTELGIELQAANL
jgi:hypothetical protein